MGPGRATARVGHELVAATLAKLGVTHCYSVPGVPIYATVAACARRGLRVIAARHQQAAALMALGHNYVAGRAAAVAMTSAGPAATNAATALLVARDNGWPLVVIAGRHPIQAEGRGYFQELDAAAFFRTLTRWSATAARPSDIPALIHTAFTTATAGRPGPVFLDLPEDVLAGSGTEAPLVAPPPEEMPITADAVAAAADALIAARRPLLVLGVGLRWSEPWEELRALVDRHRLAFVAAPTARGALPDDHPLALGAVGWAAQSQADVVVVLGAQLDWTLRFGAAIGRHAMLIHVDSAEPPLACERTAQVRVRADAGRFVCALLARLDDAAVERGASARDPLWLPALQALRARTRAEAEALGRSDMIPITPQRLAREVRDVLPRDAVLVTDGNVIMGAAQQMIQSYRPAHRMNAGSNGCMGVGIPYAIAAKLHAPQRAVVALCGDFAAGLSLIEMETAIRHRVPIVLVVANNDGNSGALRQKAHFVDHPERIAMFESSVRYDRIVESFGGHGEHVEHPAELRPALLRALASRRAAYVNVRVDPDSQLPPW